MSVVALAALVVLAIGGHFHDLNDLCQVANRAPLPLNLWAISLGAALYQEHPSLTPANTR